MTDEETEEEPGEVHASDELSEAVAEIMANRRGKLRA